MECFYLKNVSILPVTAHVRRLKRIALSTPTNVCSADDNAQRTGNTKEAMASTSQAHAIVTMSCVSYDDMVGRAAAEIEANSGQFVFERIDTDQAKSVWF